MARIAIDISDTLIRLVSLERSGRKWKLPVRAEIAVPPGYIDDGDIKHPAEVSHLLASLVSASGIRNRSVTFALPERHTFAKLISLPTDAPTDITQAVQQSLVQHIPYDISEVYWDSYSTGRVNSLGQQQILIGAVPKTTVDEYIKLFEGVHLHVDDAEIESLAITRAMLGPQPIDDARIILDLGRTRSTLILVDHGVVHFSSTLRYAGRELNRFIADELQLSDEQAERAKALFGLDPKRGKGLLRSVLAPHIDAIAEGVADVEEFFQEHFVDHRPITTIQVTGSGALLRNIDRELQDRLEQQVVVTPSWIVQQLQKTARNIPPELGYTYTSVLGLALHRWLDT